MKNKNIISDYIFNQLKKNKEVTTNNSIASIIQRNMQYMKYVEWSSS